jgi:DNA topoisomerase-3
VDISLQVRAHVEHQIDLIAHGKADKSAVVAHTLHAFAQKFAFFTEHINRMDQLFEASFSPLASSGDSHSLTLDTLSLSLKP